MVRGEEKRKGKETRREAWMWIIGGEAEVFAVSLQELNTLKASEFIWRTRTQKGNSVNISYSKNLDSSTSPTKAR